MSSEPNEQLDDLEADVPAKVKGGIPSAETLVDRATDEARGDVADARNGVDDRVDTAADKLGLHTGP